MKRSILLVCFWCSTVHFSIASAEDPVKIGAIYSMSGNVAQYGKWASQGANLAVKSSEYPVELVIEDSAGEGAKAVSAYHKLRSIDHVPIVSTLISSVALAVKPLTSRDKIVQIDISATAPSYGTKDGYQFRTGVNASQLAEAEAHFIVEKLSFNQVACIYIENDFGQGMFDVFSKHFPGKIKTTQNFRSGDADFRPQLLKIKAANPQAIWLVGHARESGILIAQARQLGIKLHIISDIYSIETPDFFAGTKDPGELTYLAPKFDPSATEPQVKSFVESYRKMYDEMPTVYAAQAHDAVLAVGKALKLCGGPIADCLVKKLRTLDFSGASGRIMFDSEGNVRKELEAKTVADGKFILSTEYNNPMEPPSGRAAHGSS